MSLNACEQALRTSHSRLVRPEMCIQDKGPVISRQRRKQCWRLLSPFSLCPFRGPANAKQTRTKQETKPMNIISLIIEAISGAVGGNVAGAAMKDNSLGTMGNSIAGIVGGGLGGTILHAVMGGTAAAAGGGSMDLTSILSNVAGG